jgi:hypothetical protein
MEKPENEEKQPNLSEASTDMKNGQSVLIIILSVLLFFSLLGVNLLTLAGNLFQSMFDVVKPVTSNVMSEASYSTGKIIDKSADLATDVGKTSLDIANGSLHSIGNLFIKAGEQGRKGDLDNTINEASKNQKHVDHDDGSPIQNRNGKTQWCLVGEYQNKRGCVEVSEQDKCLSGQVFPSQQVCLNPTLSQNAKP